MSHKSDRFLSDSRTALDTQKVAAALGLPPKSYCPHVPTPKQLAFLLCPRSEAFFGGAAGPGKTEALLMSALQLVEQPRYSALLLRRTFRQLNQSNSIMNRPLLTTDLRVRGSNPLRRATFFFLKSE
jgi:hypothetical protein